MLKSKAALKKTRITALIDSASTSTLNPIDFPVSGEYIIPSRASSLNAPVKARESITCVIEIRVTYSRRSTSTPLGWINQGDRKWIGNLWVAHRQARQAGNGVETPISSSSSDDNTKFNCRRMIQNLIDTAITLGYTHCELRDYSHNGLDEYAPVFGGLLTALRATT